MNQSYRRITGAVAIAVAGSLPAACLYAAEYEHDAHAHHHMPVADTPVPTVTAATYVVPPVRLTRADGVPVDLRQELDDGRPVIVNFIFTSCTAICPITSQIFSEVQQALGPKSPVHLVSISIDPEEDTVPKLATYAAQYGSAKGWDFYTGSQTASITAQKAFDTFRGDKMNHTPVTLMRTRPGEPWKRVEGLATSAQLVELYKSAAAVK